MEIGQSSKAAFQTQNVALAKALHIAGVPWYKNERGQPEGIFNDYTQDTLRQIDARRAREGLRPLNLSALSFADGVRTAWRNAICGEVTYRFETCDLLRRVAAGYDAQSALIAASDAGQPTGDEVVGEPLDCSPETVGAICCQFTKAGKNFQGAKKIKPLWMHVPPFMVERDLHSGSRSVKGGTEHFMEGSLRRTEVHV